MTVASPAVQTHAIKHGDTFAVLDSRGDIGVLPQSGVYYRDTRFLSRLALRLNDQEPALVNSAISDNSVIVMVDLAGHDVAIHRATFLSDTMLYQRLKISNAGSLPIELSIETAADFVDLFEVRGFKRARRGRMELPQVRQDIVQFSYEGLDHQRRETTIRFNPPPSPATATRMCFHVPPKIETVIDISVRCGLNDQIQESVAGFDDASRRLRSAA